MDAAKADLTFAPVTRAQARLFAGIARMLDRRGVLCRFAVPSAEVADALLDEWGEFVAIAGESSNGRPRDDGIPESIGAYDAWRGGWSPQQREAAARNAVDFWEREFERTTPQRVVLWNGRDQVFVESAAFVARQRGVDAIYMELGPLRRSPMTVAVSRGGVNAAARFRREAKLSEPLTPWEADRLEAVRTRFKTGVTPPHASGAYAFFPLQVDDDTQLFYYAPHFADQRAVVAAVVDALPRDVRLSLKLHPLRDARNGRVCYTPLLRPRDRIVSPQSDTLGLIASAAAVVTTNSSAGVEALMLERPVVVLGEAHYRNRGFTRDFEGRNDLRGLIQSAVADPTTPTEAAARNRYLYELLFHELVQLEHHPLSEALDEEEFERLAARLWDLVRPERLGSDWRPLFQEIHGLRESLQSSLQAAIQNAGSATLIVATRFAAACVAEVPGEEVMILEDVSGDETDRLAGRDAFLLAPDLSAGQRAAAAERLRAAGAARVHDLTHRLSAQPCPFHISRFNGLPRDLRDDLYRSQAYWDYYLTHSGIHAENTPQKNVQAEKVAQWLRQAGPNTVLEYGCGDGRILQRLTAADDGPWKRLVGVDSSERMLMLARARLGNTGEVKLLPADARAALPFADASFDAVLTCGALQHIHAADLPEVLQRLHRVARRALIHWEAYEAHRATPGEHYTNPDASRAIHGAAFARFGPIGMQVEEVRPLTGQDALLTRYDLDSPQITVLTLHAVGTPDPSCESFDYRNMFVSAEQLAELVDGLLARGYRFLTLREARACARGKSRTPHKAVVLTFDDGYASVFEAARPVLAERGIRAAAFVSTGFLGHPFGGNTRHGSGPALATLTAERLRNLRDDGWDIGSHSVSHPVFAGLSADEAKRELVESKTHLEKLLGENVSTFAFPYGEPDVAFRPEHVEMAAQVGYELVLTMKPGFVQPGWSGHLARNPSDPRAAAVWPRVGVGCETTPESLLDELAAVHRTVNGWPAQSTARELSLKDRVRGVVRRCVEKGVERIALYGAGRHTAKLLQTAPLWPLHVLGIVDDNTKLHGHKRYGLPIYAPSDLSTLAPDAVLISSDQYEEAIYQRIAPLEARGIRVLRLYANGT